MKRQCGNCRYEFDSITQCSDRGCMAPTVPAWEPKVLEVPVTLPSAPEVQPELLHSFSHALLLLKMGKRVAREGWNGKGMWLYLVHQDQYPARTQVAIEHWGPDALVPYLAYIAMKTVDDTVVPWAASQTDILSEDWLRLD